MNEKLVLLLDAGADLTLQRVAKRMGPENDRDWFARHIWNFTFQGKTHECAWEGFATAQESLADLLVQAETLYPTVFF
jgi:hypothetical protein